MYVPNMLGKKKRKEKDRYNVLMVWEGEYQDPVAPNIKLGTQVINTFQMKS